MATVRDAVRNLRLMGQSAAQHLADDPALLAVQISRRLPFAVRIRAGRALRAVGMRVPGGEGAAALGAYMAGDEPGAERLVERSGAASRMRDEVAVLVDRMDLVGSDSSSRTRARAAWARGRMSEAVSILEADGLGDSAYGCRLRSELELLQPGARLELPQEPLRSAPPADGEDVRVLHLITNSLPHTQSGYSLRTHRVLRALADQGVRSVALTRTGYPVMVGKLFARSEDVVDGISYRRTLPARLASTPGGRLEQEAAEAMRIVRELRPHVIHATTDYRNALVAQAVSRATGIPWVLEVRGLMEQTWIASHRDEHEREAARESEKVRLVAAREGELARDADAVVTLSRTMADALEARGVPADRIALVPNGVDSSLFEDHVSPAEARRLVGLDLPDNAFVVGAVSALVDYEGLDVLLRAVALILADEAAPAELRDRLYVVIAGEGVARPGLVRLAEELGIANRLIAPGRVPRQQARRWVEALDAVVVPRLDREVARSVTPQKPVEAMALGRPVIASDLPALRETVEGERRVSAGVLVPAGDAGALAEALVALISSEDERELLSEGGLSLAKERLWPSLMGRYGVLYADLMTDEPSRTSEVTSSR